MTGCGNPEGRIQLPLPEPNEAERIADRKQMLRECLLAASQTTGRRRETVAKRFNQHRRQLLATLDRDGWINSSEAGKR